MLIISQSILDYDFRNIETSKNIPNFGNDLLWPDDYFGWPLTQKHFQERVGIPSYNDNLDSSPSIFPPGSSKTKFPPQEAFVIWVPTNCQFGLTAILWSEKSSAYKLLKVSRVMNDFEIALNKVNPKNLFSMLLLNQYHFQNYFCVTILSSP